MIVKITFNNNVLTVFKDDVEVPDVRVQFSKAIQRPPTEVKIGKVKSEGAEANADFTAVRWEFRCEVPTDMEMLVDSILS